MAVRATEDLKNAIIKTYLVKAATTAVAGRACMFGATDTEVEISGAGDEVTSIGVFMEAAAAGTRVQVCLLGASVIKSMIVGTGGCTRGQRQKLAADGITDITGATDHSVGTAMQSGVIGDIVGVRLDQA
jgi:hypothetical protein